MRRSCYDEQAAAHSLVEEAVAACVVAAQLAIDSRLLDRRPFLALMLLADVPVAAADAEGEKADEVG